MDPGLVVAPPVECRSCQGLLKRSPAFRLAMKKGAPVAKQATVVSEARHLRLQDAPGVGSHGPSWTTKYHK